MPNEQDFERHHQEHKNLVPNLLEKLKIPAEEALLVGSGSIVHQLMEQYLNRRPGDFDFLILSEQVWKNLQTIGNEIAGPIGNTVIQISIDGWNFEFFQYLPGLSERMTKNSFKKAQWINGAMCMDLITLAVWKCKLAVNKDRSEKKRAKDWSDAFTICKSVFTGFAKNYSEMIDNNLSFQSE